MLTRDSNDQFGISGPASVVLAILHHEQVVNHGTDPRPALLQSAALPFELEDQTKGETLQVPVDVPDRYRLACLRASPIVFSLSPIGDG